jgi:NDT80 / PhoG like DNA-binding  family
MSGEEGHSGRQTRNGNSNSDSSMADDLLQLSFLQSDELSKFLSPSKEWILDPNEADTQALDEVDMSPVDFFGHYSVPGVQVFGGMNDNGFTPQPGTITPFISQAVSPSMEFTNNNHNQLDHSQSMQGLNLQGGSNNLALPTSNTHNTQQPANSQTQTDNGRGGNIGSVKQSSGPWDNVQSGGHETLATEPFQSFLNTFDSPRSRDVNLSYAAGHPADLRTQTPLLVINTPEMTSTNTENTAGASSGIAELSDTRKQSKLTGGKRPSEEIQSAVVSAKYLEFLPSNQQAVIYDTRGNTASVVLTASLMGNFFLSQSNPIDESGAPSVPQQQPQSHLHLVKEDLSNFDLTFYRRNLFQVIATVSNSHNAAYVGNSENPQLRSRILSLSLAVTVMGNDSPHPKKLLYSPPKAVSSEKKAVHEPAVKFFYPKNSGYDEVINWKRLQFRNATAHNGRKKLQNYFSVCVSLFAELENTQRVCLADGFSRPVIVRGRNPRFYQNRDFISIPYDGNLRSVMYHTGADFDEESQIEEKMEDKDESPDEKHEDSRRSTLRRPSSAIDPKDISGRGAFVARPTEKLPVRSSPIKKEEVDDSARATMKGKSVSKRGDPRPRVQELSNSPTHGSNKDEDYEYFPMPLNYWLPPVEVVYRPHAIHHPLKYPRGKSQASIDNSKRYFSAVE